MKALIAMSGGVDSAVAACLMRERGYECMGVTMKLYCNEDLGIGKGHTCCSLEDVEDARSVAYRLHMPHYVFNFSERFRECVIVPFVEAYQNGRTPNPCIRCNQYLKFDTLYRRARALHCDYVVTGHYARIEYDAEADRYLLKKAMDVDKDQSYVLYTMTQDQLRHTLFPLGALSKPDVRRMAEERGLVNARKHDSQDICFVPDGDYAGFIERYTQQSCPEGLFVSTDGTVLGTHKGIIRYTVGQRRGLGVQAQKPLYVCRICPEENTVVLGMKESLYSKEIFAEDFHWISGEVPDGDFRCKVKVRYRQQEQWATVTPFEGKRIRIVFDEPQRAVTPGQAAVLYDGDVVLGGGVLTESE